MTDGAARKHLARMLRSYTGGSILGLLGEVFQEMAEEARREGDDARHDQYEMASITLTVVGLGIDAITPR
jgi:hypothetical protein